MRTCLPPSMKTFAALALAAWLAAPAFGQFKVVGPDGRVTYTDRPPAAQSGQASGRPAPAGAPIALPLPFELRQVTTRFPVTLYSAADCAPCDAGRQLLRERGVPHTERLIEKNEDVDALERLTGSRQVPVVRIGGQVLRGYSTDDWNSYLNTAGYPANSQLPPGYQYAAATPLVAASTPPERAAEAPQQPAAAPEPLPTVPPPIPPAGNAPPGFRF